MTKDIELPKTTPDARFNAVLSLAKKSWKSVRVRGFGVVFEQALSRGIFGGLPGLIGHIGRPGFEAQLLRLYRGTIRADCLAIFLIGAGEQLEDWRVLDDTSFRCETIKTMREFLTHAWPHDYRLFDSGATETGVNLVSRRRAADIDDPEYRELCYTRPGVIDRLLMTHKESAKVLHICAYRRKSSNHFSDTDIVTAAGLAPMVLAACYRHLNTAHGRTALVEEYEVTGARALTYRESEIANLVAEGATSRDIAAELGISSHTVLTHRKRIYEKLGVRSQRELLAYRYGALSKPSAVAVEA